MNAEAIKSEFQIFEECEIVERPYKPNYTGRFDGLLKAVENLDSTKAIKLPLSKYELNEKTAKSLMNNLRPTAKRKYGYRLGGTVKDSLLYLWRNL